MATLENVAYVTANRLEGKLNFAAQSQNCFLITSAQVYIGLELRSEKLW